MIVGQEKPSLEELRHHGVKGMKWGIRKEDPSASNRLRFSGVEVDKKLPSYTRDAGVKVAKLMYDRYGFSIANIKAIPLDHAEHEHGTLGYVELTPGKSEGTIYARQTDIRRALKDSEAVGWLKPGCGTPEGLFTHEASHALFHAPQEVEKKFLRGSKIVGGNIEARDKAFAAMTHEMAKEGPLRVPMLAKISGYANDAGTREEMEGELFSQYHWNPHPEPFVKAWGETLHRELGVDATPFREVLHV